MHRLCQAVSVSAVRTAPRHSVSEGRGGRRADRPAIKDDTDWWNSIWEKDCPVRICLGRHSNYVCTWSQQLFVVHNSD